MNIIESGGPSRPGRPNPADNLTQDDRIRGGRRSAAQQNRDRSGRFSGRKDTPRESREGQEQRPKNEPASQSRW